MREADLDEVLRWITAHGDKRSHSLWVSAPAEGSVELIRRRGIDHIRRSCVVVTLGQTKSGDPVDVWCPVTDPQLGRAVGAGHVGCLWSRVTADLRRTSAADPTYLISSAG